MMVRLAAGLKTDSGAEQSVSSLGVSPMNVWFRVSPCKAVSPGIRPLAHTCLPGVPVAITAPHPHPHPLLAGSAVGLNGFSPFYKLS